MRSTITIEDSLFNEAAKIYGDNNISNVVTAALKSYVQAEAAKRLILLGGSMPDFSVPSRASRTEGMLLSEDEADYNA